MTIMVPRRRAETPNSISTVMAKTWTAMTALAFTAACSGSANQTGIPKGFVGDWERHGESLTINSDGTGELEYRTYEEPDAGSNMWREVLSMRFSMSSDGKRLIGTALTVRDIDSHGKPTAQQPDAHAGDQWAYFLKPNGALDEHQIKPTSSTPAADDNAWCRKDIQDIACGA